MADQKRTSSGTGPKEGFVEKRRDERYAVPDNCKGYIGLQIKTGDQYLSAALANFSRSGILFEIAAPLEAGSERECVMSVSLLVARDVSFKIRVKYCLRNNNSYIIGAAIDAISDENWFDIFAEIHEFIAVNKDSMRS